MEVQWLLHLSKLMTPEVSNCNSARNQARIGRMGLVRFGDSADARCRHEKGEMDVVMPDCL